MRSLDLVRQRDMGCPWGNTGYPNRLRISGAHHLQKALGEANQEINQTPITHPIGGEARRRLPAVRTPDQSEVTSAIGGGVPLTRATIRIHSSVSPSSLI
jgi:hypothetical protein